MEERKIFVDDDRARHIPAGVQHHIFHTVREFRAALILDIGAHHRSRDESDFTIIHDLGGEIREINPNMPIAEGLVVPTFPLHRHKDRLQACRCGHVDLAQCALPRDSVGVKAMIQLEPLNGLLQRPVIDGRGGPAHISHTDQSVAKRYDRIRAIAGSQVNVRVDRCAPIAGSDDPLEIELGLEKPGVFLALRRQCTNESGRRRFGKGVKDGAAITMRHPPLDIFHHVAGNENAGLNIPRIAQEYAAQIDIDLPKFSLTAGAPDICLQSRAVIPRRRQTMIAGFVKGRKKCRPASPLIFAGANPQPTKIASPIEIEQNTIVRGRLGNRLTESGTFLRHNSCSAQRQ